MFWGIRVTSLSLLLHIFQKIKVSIMGMFYTVRTGYALSLIHISEPTRH